MSIEETIKAYIRQIKKTGNVDGKTRSGIKFLQELSRITPGTIKFYSTWIRNNGDVIRYLNNVLPLPESIKDYITSALN